MRYPRLDWELPPNKEVAPNHMNFVRQAHCWTLGGLFVVSCCFM
jgi:hypothetical protein